MPPFHKKEARQIFDTLTDDKFLRSQFKLVHFMQQKNETKNTEFGQVVLPEEPSRTTYHF